MTSKDALHDITEKVDESIDFISYDDKDELEKLEHLTEQMKDIADIIHQYKSDNPDRPVYIEGNEE